MKNKSPEFLPVKVTNGRDSRCLPEPLPGGVMVMVMVMNMDKNKEGQRQGKVKNNLTKKI